MNFWGETSGLILLMKCIALLYMKASVVDLRYRMKDVLKALDRKEEVTVLYRGKVKGKIVPQAAEESVSALKHPMFGVAKNDDRPMDEVIAELREGRLRGF